MDWKRIVFYIVSFIAGGFVTYAATTDNKIDDEAARIVKERVDDYGVRHGYISDTTVQ